MWSCYGGGQKICLIMKFIIFVFIGLFFFSCQDKERAALLDRVEEMHEMLDSMKTVADESQIDTLHLLVEHIKQRTSVVKKYYIPDTVEYNIARMMNDYKEVRKALSTNSGNLSKVRQSIPEVKESLDNLQHDIKHGVGERDRYEEYVDFESQKVKKIHEILTYYLETKEKYSSLYRETEPKINEFIEHLKSAQENQE